eukprot:TRINITY_DN2454_c0_g1_i2.p1 TRINITY_DN2454_c0_g1~~TRINITY_DN2454_c0_g1_i2.p1  ORF type:complete len:743 (+),score=218.39 TRINITY_DN2454_c0_g1_i2:87-2315(+)
MAAPGPAVATFGYNPEEDLRRLAAYLSDRYGSLDTALAQFDPDAELDLVEFESWLHKWGLSKDVNTVDLFDYIDIDGSSTIDIDELFRVLALPAQQIKQRQKEQLEKEVSEIYELLAQLIHQKLGTVEEYFAKLRLQSAGDDSLPLDSARRASPTKPAPDAAAAAAPAGAEPPNSARRQSVGAAPQQPAAAHALSRAEFRRLARQIGLEEHLGGEDLSATKLAKVFDAIDKDKPGSISLDELSQALCGYLVRIALVDIAERLTAEHGSVDAAFALLPAPAALQTAAKDEGTVDDLKNMLRRLSKDLPVLGQDETLRLMCLALKPFSQDEMKRRLVVEHSASTEAKKRRADLAKQKEDARRRRLRRRFCDRTKEIADQAVDDWEKAVAKGAAPEDVTRAWANSARAARCQAQLQDYVAALEQKAFDREEDVLALKVKIGELQEAIANSGGAAIGTPASCRMRADDCATPVTPAMSVSSPSGGASRFHRQNSSTLRQCSKATQAAKLVQAIGVGDCAAVDLCLRQGADPNAVAWGGITPLMAAARHNRDGVMHALLAARADVGRTDARGRTAVDHAFRSPAALTWLRAHGAPSSKELAKAAEVLAQRLLKAEAEKKRLAGMQESISVLKRAGSQRRDRNVGSGDTSTPTPASMRAGLTPPPSILVRPALSGYAPGAFGGAGFPMPPAGMSSSVAPGCAVPPVPLPAAACTVPVASVPSRASVGAAATGPLLAVPSRRKSVQWDM